MLKIACFLLMFVSAVQFALADVFVITDKSNSVYSVSDQNDALVPLGDTLTVLKGKNISNLPIVGSPQLYNFVKGAFTINTAAVQAVQSAQVSLVAAQQAKDAARASAIAKLTDAISKVNANDVLTTQEMSALLPSS